MEKIEHIGIAVKDLAAANEVYTKLFGEKPYKTETVESEGVATSFFKDLGEAGYLVLIGTSAYTNAGARAERVLHPVMKGIYNELGEKFIYVASLLAKVFGRDLVLDNLVQLDAHFSSYRDLRSYQALMDKGLLIGNTSDS